MKKVFFLLAMFICFFASCSDGGNEEPVTPPTQKPEVDNTPTITIDPTIQSSGLSFDVSASEKSITFSTTADWTLSIAETRSGTEWCTASPTSGGKGTATVKFKTTENTESEDRSVAVTIKAGTASKTFTVTQKGNKSLLLTTKKYELPKEGGEIEIEVKANVEYEMTIAESAKKWITEATGRALTTHKHILAIAASEEAVKREGEITFKSGDIVETVKVYQAGEAVLVLSKNEFTVSEAGETISVDIKSNVDFGVQMPDVDWIKEEDASRAMSSHTLKFVVAENETSEARSAEIVFYDKNSDLKNTLKVAQRAKEQKEGSYENGVATLVEAGTLKELLGEDMLKITSLKIVGPINGDDVIYLRKMLGDYNNFSEADWGKLTTLDLSEATIVEGGDNGYELYTSNNVIGEYMFHGCANLQNIILPDGVTSIGDGAFEYCRSLTSVTIGNGVTSIGSEAFCGCHSLTSVTIPDNVTSIGNYAFKLCYSLTSVTIGNGVTSIGQSTFWGCSALTSVTIGNGVTSIGDDAFYSCSSLTSVTIPDNVTSIGDCAFYDCSALTSVTIGNGVTSIGFGAFEFCRSLTSVTIPDNVTSIGNCAFCGCEALTSVTIGNGVTSIGAKAFLDCSSLTSVTIGNGVTSIGDEAFLDCRSLTSVTIGNGVTSIGDKAFHDCKALTSVTIPDNVTSIGDDAFCGCEALTSVTIPDNVTSIGNYTFKICYSLTSVTIGNGVTSIGIGAFEYCRSLTSVTIGNGVTSIGDEAFKLCSSLTSVTIPDNVTSIGSGAFCLCDALTSVTIGNGVTSIGDKAFYRCSSLTSVTIPDSVTSIEGSAFRDCSSLTSVTIGNGVTSIEGSAFRDCSSLTSVTIGNGVTSIGQSTFWGCSALTSFYCYAQYSPEFGTSCFYRINPEATLYVPAGRGSEYKSSWGKYFKNIIEMD